jgi:hypothetical protein
MTRSRVMTPRKALASIALLFGLMVTTLLPAFGQEIDPTWYNPWPAANTAVAPTSQPPAAVQRHQAALKRVSSAQGTRKSRGKAAHNPNVAVLAHLAK